MGKSRMFCFFTHIRYETNNANNSGYREQIRKYLFTFATG